MPGSTVGPILFDLPAPTGAGGLSQLSFFAGTTVSDLTVLRTHDEFFLQLKQIGGIGLADSWTFAIGLGIVTNEAGAAGSVPNPAESSGGADWDGWFVHQQLTWNTDTVGDFIEPRKIVIDSKAMRKVQDGSGIVIAVGLQATNSGTTGSLQVSVNPRFLVLLP